MVRSSAADLRELRSEVFERDNWQCVWPGCMNQPEQYGDPTHTLQLSHLQHRGMGGSAERNTPDNCVTLCALHHDCLDGRTGLGVLRQELNRMLRAQI